MGDMHVIDDESASRYEIRVDGELAGLIDYLPGDGQRNLIHVEVFERFRGRGVAEALAAGAVADLRARGLALIPSCPYLHDRYLPAHPEDLDLVPPDVRARFGLG